MRGSLTVEMGYQRYQQTEERTYTVEPYCLKLFHQRWYLLARTKGEFRVFALDRIKRLAVTGRRFEADPYFDAEDFFAVVCQHEIDHLDGVLYKDKAENYRKQEAQK